MKTTRNWASCLCVSTEEDEEDEEDEEEVRDRSQPRWTVWLDVESSREAAQWIPWRPDKAKGQSEEDCEDPDRQVPAVPERQTEISGWLEKSSCTFSLDVFTVTLTIYNF